MVKTKRKDRSSICSIIIPIRITPIEKHMIEMSGIKPPALLREGMRRKIKLKATKEKKLKSKNIL